MPWYSVQNPKANCPWGDPRCMGGHKSACLEACAQNCELTAPGTPDCPLGDPNCVPPGVSVHNYRVNSVQTNNPYQCRDECSARCHPSLPNLDCARRCQNECALTAPGTPDEPIPGGRNQPRMQSSYIAPHAACYNDNPRWRDVGSCLRAIRNPIWSDIGRTPCSATDRDRPVPCEGACNGVQDPTRLAQCKNDCQHCLQFP